MSSADDPRGFVHAVASRKEWALPKNPAFLNDVISGLAANRKRYGYYLCPCREGWGIKEKDRDIVCPCRYAAADIEDHGHCYCGLFFSAAFSSGGREAGPIPDRRPDELYPE